MKELNSRSEDGSVTGLSDGSMSYNYANKFRKEAQNLARMEHPNIVHVTDCFDENGTFYYVMEYIEGEDLNSYIKQHVLSEFEAVSIIKDVANALIYMHEEKRMLHLDLKPGNIMRRNSDGHIFLIDFGLSKHYDKVGMPETSTTIGLGTVGYAPIEQANQTKNGEFRPTIDVYALGATLFKLLTRETPPPASDLVSDEGIIYERMKSFHVSANLASVIVKAMCPNVKKRYQNIREFVDALQPEGRIVVNDFMQVENDEDETIVTRVTTKPNRPDAHIVLAVIGLCVCLPFGIISLKKAMNVDSLYDDGDYNGAEEASAKAFRWGMWSFGGWVIFLIIFIFCALCAN